MSRGYYTPPPIMENHMENEMQTREYKGGYIGITEKRMETTFSTLGLFT